jgi:hypothetical protein
MTADQSKSAAKFTMTAPAKSATKSTVPAESATKSTAPAKSATNTAPAMTPVMITAQEEIAKESVVGGMQNEDDSEEQELAMLSPLKGTELRASKVRFLYYPSIN